MGRFIQPDSIIADAYSSQALNGYSYVLGNPLRYVDPLGYKAEIPWDDQAAIENDTSSSSVSDTTSDTSGGRPAQLPPDDQVAMKSSGETESGTVVGTEDDRVKITAKPGVDLSKLRPEITDRYQDIIDVFKQNSAPDPIITDTYQSDKHMTGSRHYTNEAIDLRGNNVSDEKLRELSNALQLRVGSDYDVIAEIFPDNPVRDHIHFEYDPKDRRVGK